MKARNYTPIRGGKKTPLTIRQMEALRLENQKKNRKDMMEFELDILSTPKKPLKSVPKLAQALNAFFSEHLDDPYITLNELAKAIGYSDEDAMVKDTFNVDNRPEYNALVKKAIGRVEDIYTRRMLAISDKAGDTRGYQIALQRMDKKRDKYDPDSVEQDVSTKINVSVKVQEDEKIKSMLDDRLNGLLASAKGKAIDVVPRSIPEPVPVLSEPVQQEALNG